MLGSASDAEDAVQHTFIAAHVDIQRHDGRDLHVKAWLYTIARNRCLSMLRARREQPSDEVFDVATDNLLGEVQHRDDIRALLGDIAKLPDDQREALVLAEVGDLSHRDIGAILGCEASKVKSLVFQARTALIDRRAARDTPCAEIREQLATLRGGALRRSHLRHHLEACPGCTEYREQVRRQRAMLAVALPVLPSAALKANVLGAIGIGGTAAAAGTGAAATASQAGFAASAPGAAVSATAGGGGLLATGGIAAKIGIVAALAAGGVGGATVANNGVIPLVQHPAAATEASPSHSAGNAGTSPAHTGPATTTKHQSTGSRRSASGTAHGFTPVTRESNGERARAFAQTRGKGKQTSAAHRHVTAHTRARPATPVKTKHVAAPRKNGLTRTQPTPAPRTNTQATPAPPATTPEAATTTPTSTQPAPSPTGGRGGSGAGSGKAPAATGGALDTATTG
jgi:RNA polymerase sigma factor (sigma-70 family)